MSKNKWAGTVFCPSPIGIGTHTGVFQLSQKMNWSAWSLNYLRCFDSIFPECAKHEKARETCELTQNTEPMKNFSADFFFFSLGSDISLKWKLSLGTHQLEQNSSLSLLTKLQTPEVYKSWNCIGNTYRHVAWIQTTIYTPQEAGVYRGRRLLPPKALGVFPSFLMEARSIPYYGNAKRQIAWAQGSCSFVWPLLYICWIITLSAIFLVQ